MIGYSLAPIVARFLLKKTMKRLTLLTTYIATGSHIILSEITDTTTPSHLEPFGW